MYVSPLPGKSAAPDLPHKVSSFSTIVEIETSVPRPDKCEKKGASPVTDVPGRSHPTGSYLLPDPFQNLSSMGEEENTVSTSPASRTEERRGKNFSPVFSCSSSREMNIQSFNLPSP